MLPWRDSKHIDSLSISGKNTGISIDSLRLVEGSEIGLEWVLILLGGGVLIGFR